MNCCDEYGKCRQQQDCPVRVAKIKSRMPKYPTPLRQEINHNYRRYLAGWMLVVIATLYLVAIIAGVTHA